MSKQPFVADDLLRMRFLGHPVLSPDGEQILFVQTEVLEKENGYASSIYRYANGRISLFTNRGAQTRVRDAAPAWSPDGSRVAFLSNRSGSNQVWLLTLDGGEAEQLTDLPKGVSSFVWASDGQSLILAAKELKEQPPLRPGATARRITRLRYKANGAGYLDGMFTQLWKLDLGSRSVRRLTEGDFNCSGPAPSPCGRYLAFISNRNADERKTLNDIWLLDMSRGELRALTDSDGPCFGLRWTPDGKLLYLGHQKGIYPGGYPELRQIDPQTGTNINLLPDFPHYIGNTIGADARFDGGNTGLVLSADGQLIYFAATIGGSSYLFCFDRLRGSVERVYGDGQMYISSYDIKNGRLVVNHGDPTTTGDLRYGPVGGDLQQITGVNQELFADKYIGWPEVIHFTHPDGTVLEGWLIKPLGFEEGSQYPLVMEIHGGPHTTYGNSFFHEFQILAGHGFGVLYTNPRGSLGYGEEFARACVGDWCGVDADDLQFMAEQAAELPWVDKQRIGVTGGSQGGYFTNWLIGHTDMFAAAVTQRSMSNLYTKYGTADNGWNGDRYGMGGRDLWDDEDFIMERSPMRYARDVKTPTLIIHSDQDFRCPLEQAEQWYVALKRLGVTTEMLLFHGENHELSRSGKPANRLVRLDAILDWFTRYLQS